MKTAVVLFAHGSRDAAWAAPFRAVQQRVAAGDATVTVELAFLEFMEPSLEQAIDRVVAAGCTQISIAPLFMAQGAHLKRDLACIVTAVREKHGHVAFKILPAAGEAEAVVDAMSRWIRENA